MKKTVLFLLLVSITIIAKEYHVAKTGSNSNDGSLLKPFLTIAQAVNYAVPGDTITVHAGTYREWVNPIRGGESDLKRIVYRAAPGELVEVKGSEVIKDWQNVKGNVWKVTIPNSFFGDYNPYKDSIYGDWFNGLGRGHHTGEVFLNGKSLYERENLEKVFTPAEDKNTKDPEGAKYVWYCESDSNNTTIWANFNGYNPNKELAEISARRTCFYPSKPWINYITISGFHFSEAATQWGAPTAEQVGMVSTNWNKGWIIENNVISESKCSGITLGKERSTGQNVWSADKGNVYNDGNIHYIEVVFKVLRYGWNKEHIGSHIVRNNTIFDCGQTGICGSMGAAFSTIENNHIYNINAKRQFTGAEIGGIKFHAAVDAVIKHNRIHDTPRAIWLDWMTQGTRVTQNLFYNNDAEDLFLEVNHGPFVVDNNIFLSNVSVRTQSEGGAYINNLFAGSIDNYPDPNRFTPYFLPHSTDIKGLTTVMGGDDRYYNNIFVGRGKDSKTAYGLKGYDNTKLPDWIDGNIYYNGAEPSAKDKNELAAQDFDPGMKLIEEGKNVYLNFTFDSSFYNNKAKLITSGILGKAKIPKAEFENADGTALTIDKDYFGKERTNGNNSAGPFINLSSGKQVVKVW